MDTSRPDREYSAFISHASKDRKAALAIVQHLEAKGLTCWIAPRDVVPGREYPDEIVRGIEKSKCFVIVLSEAANTSPHVRREIERAASKDKSIYPIRIENVPPSARLEYFISMHHWVDAFEGMLADHADKLVSAIDSRLTELPKAHPESAGRYRFAAYSWRYAAIAAVTLCAVSGSIVFLLPSPTTSPSIDKKTDQSPAIPTSPPAPPIKAADSGPDAEFFRPNVVFSNGGWGVHMPARVNSRFINTRLFYSFDGNDWQEASSSSRFFFVDRPPTKELHLRISSGGTTFGPFIYRFDYGALKTAELIRDGLLRSAATSRVYEPAPGSVGGFPIIASFKDESLHIQAIVEDDVARYQGEFGSGFWDNFVPNSSRSMVVPFFSSITKNLKPDTNIGLIVFDKQEQKSGPFFYSIDISKLMMIDWYSRFEEQKAILCERVAAVAPGFGRPPSAASVECRPNNYGEASTRWSGIRRVDYGSNPSDLANTADVAPRADELLSGIRLNIATGVNTSLWGRRQIACYVSSEPQELCPFRVSMPADTESVYARIRYFDDRLSPILRFAVR